MTGTSTPASISAPESGPCDASYCAGCSSPGAALKTMEQAKHEVSANANRYIEANSTTAHSVGLVVSCRDSEVVLVRISANWQL